MTPRAHTDNVPRERAPVARLAAVVLCVLTLLVGGTLAAASTIASSATGADGDDVVSVESVAPIEIESPRRRCSRALFSLPRRRHCRRPRTSPRLGALSQLVQICSGVPRRGPPALLVP